MFLASSLSWMDLVLPGLLLISFWVALVVAALNPIRYRIPRSDLITLGLWLICYGYCRIRHRVRFEDADGIRSWNPSRANAPVRGRGPLIVVSNHTAGVDPVLIQLGLQFEIRWIMMKKMDVGLTRFFTWYLSTILVNQDGTDFAPLRDAIRHLRAGHALGVFPEGGIERPPEHLRAFESGVGFLVRKTGATVLPVWVSGTPYASSAGESLLMTSRSRVAFGSCMTFDPESSPQEITDAIKERIRAMSGWPDVDSDANHELTKVADRKGRT
jgi:1-acyl-sn-glycerol-3-phosphate acyltransferase